MVGIGLKITCLFLSLLGKCRMFPYYDTVHYASRIFSPEASEDTREPTPRQDRHPATVIWGPEKLE